MTWCPARPSERMIATELPRCASVTRMRAISGRTRTTCIALRRIFADEGGDVAHDLVEWTRGVDHCEAFDRAGEIEVVAPTAVECFESAFPFAREQGLGPGVEVDDEIRPGVEPCEHEAVDAAIERAAVRAL